MTPTPPQAGERAEASALRRAREFLAGKPRRSCDWMADDILSALVAEIDAAPVVAITECNQIEGARDFDWGDMSAAVQHFTPGQTVRLLALDSGGAGEVANNFNRNEEKGDG